MLATLIVLIGCTTSIKAQDRDCLLHARKQLLNNDYKNCIQVVDSCLGINKTAALYNLKANAILGSGPINDEKNDLQALELLTKAISLDSMDAGYFNNRGWVYQFLNQYRNATKDFDKAVTLSPDRVAYHHNTLRILWLRRRYKDAMKKCDELIKRFPNDGYAFHVRGNLKRDYLHKYIEGNKDIKISKELGWAGGILLEY